MSVLRADPPARVMADDGHALRIMPPRGQPFTVTIAELRWIAFLNIGDSFLANEDGWWLFGSGTGATAVWHGCPAVDTALRGPLAAAADALGDLSILHVAETPRMLRDARRSGVAELDADDLDRLRRAATAEPVGSVRAMPVLP